MTSIHYFLLFMSSATAAAGQLLLKLGANRGGWEIIKSPYFWTGGLCYFISFVLWVYALSKADLSAVYPFTALTFVLVFLASFVLLGETATPAKFLGVGLVLAGFFVLFKTS